MLENKSLREICACTGATRRAIQGYEKAGLVAPAGRNKYGHLLYDAAAESRIRRIRFYQQMGCSIREIGRILEGPPELGREILERKILQMEKERDKLQQLLEKARALLEQTP